MAADPALGAEPFQGPAPKTTASIGTSGADECQRAGRARQSETRARTT